MKHYSLLFCLCLLTLMSCRKDDPEPIPEPEPTFTSSSLRYVCPEGMVGNAGAVTRCADQNFVAVTAVNDSVDIVKFDASGNQLWRRSLVETSLTHAFGITEASDGSLFICGNILPSAQTDLYIAKLAANGDSLWTKRFNFPGDDGGYSIITASDGNLVVNIYSTTGTKLMKMDANGDSIWCMNYTTPGIMYHLIETNDGGFLLTGSTAPYWNGGQLLYLKTDALGAQQWSSTTLSYSEGHYTLENTNGEFITCGHCEYNGTRQAFISKADASGNNMRFLDYGDPFNAAQLDVIEKSYAIYPESDGTFLVAGHVEGNGNYLGNSFVFRTNVDFTLGASYETAAAISDATHAIYSAGSPNTYYYIGNSMSGLFIATLSYQ